MSYLTVLWLKFLACAVIVVFAGVKITRYADILSERHQLNKAWVGMLLLGVITSLPELVASFSAAVFLNSPNLSVGNIAGSVNFNLIIVAILDLLYRKEAITNKLPARRTYDFSAEFYGIMASLLVIELFLSSQGYIFSIGHISFGFILIILSYILGVKIIFSPENNDLEIFSSHGIVEKGAEEKYLVQKLVLSALAVVLGGLWLSAVCDKLAIYTSLGSTFVGTTLLAIVTSLPEVVVSVCALKMGSFDLAFGNIFGSNMFNILILAICEIFYTPGPLLAFASPTHLLMLTLSVLMTTILIIGIQVRNKKKIFGMGLDSILLLICFVISIKFLYDLK